MKKALLLAIICTGLIAGCTKEPSTPATTPTTTDTNKFEFVINGATDVTMGKDTFAILALGIAREKGTQEKVTLSLTGLPANVTAAFSSQSGTPDFATSLTITAKDAIPGTYPVKLVGTTESNIIKSYDITLTITGVKPGDPDPVLGCAKELLGNFTSYYTHKGQNKVNPSVNVESTGVKDEIKISYGVFSKPIVAQINCSAKQLIIAEQYAMDWTLTNGSGNYPNKDTIYISYTLTGPETQPVTEMLVRN